MAESASRLGSMRPPVELAEKYRRDALWRDESPLDDLRRWRDRTPDATAVIAHRAATGKVERLTYRELAEAVERFAGILIGLGVRPGQVVAVQLPNWWQSGALFLACARIGATVAPLMPTLGAREVERILARLPASVCVTPSRWSDTDYEARIAEMAPRLPGLRHRVVLGGAAYPGAVDLDRLFDATAGQGERDAALDGFRDDPDRGFMVLFTSGTSGEPKGVVHSHNTLHAAIPPFAAEERLGEDDVIMTPHAAMHIMGVNFSILLPLLVGGATVLVDGWDPDLVLDLAADHGLSCLAAAPVFLSQLFAAQRREARDLSSLHLVLSGATTVPPQLVGEMHAVLGRNLRSMWGMTEVPGTWSRSDAPADWAAHSAGLPSPALNLELRGEPDAPLGQPARLFVRGASVCLATFGRDSSELTPLADDWYDTGDLAVSDGRGGIRIAGRSDDRIGGAFMIPVADVEAELLDHPDVTAVALVGYPDGSGGELACAVVVSRSADLTLAELRVFLTGRGMTEWYQPSRLEIVGELPRNAAGKVQKAVLRKRLREIPA